MIRSLAFICLCVGVYAHSGDIGGRSPPGQDPLTPHCSFSLCALCWFLGELHWLSYEAFSIPQARLSFFFRFGYCTVNSLLQCLNSLFFTFGFSLFDVWLFVCTISHPRSRRQETSPLPALAYC